MCKPMPATTAGAETPTTTAAAPTKQCSICKTTFPSRSALFKHLRSGACDARLAQAPTKANAILQIGYHSAAPDAVEAALRRAVGAAGAVKGRTGASSTTRAHLALAPGAAAWGDARPVPFLDQPLAVEQRLAAAALASSVVINSSRSGVALTRLFVLCAGITLGHASFRTRSLASRWSFFKDSVEKTD